MSETFAHWVKRRRKALDLTQNDLAARIACSPETIKKIESQQRQPSRQLAELLIAELEVDRGERDHLMSLARGIEISRHRLSQHAFLPLPLTSLIDRIDEINKITGMLLRPDVRLLTLTGPGGVGKTRLAIQAASMLQEEFDGHVHLISLESITQPVMLASAVAQALDISAHSEVIVRQRLLDHLRAKRTLLVLDNFEQILPAALDVRAWLEALPGLKVLVTSRARLNLSGEFEYGVPSMQVPDLNHLPPAHDLMRSSPAVDLFVQRVNALQPGFQLTEANARPVAEICALLDGIPLAIELAAARCKLLEPHELLARLKASSTLDLLTHGPQDLPARQQTIRKAIDWSYDLLDETERQLFVRLGIFSGGATFEAIEAVCGDTEKFNILDALTSLVDQNLLWREERAHALPRFQMLTTLREYALEQLSARDEWTACQRAHATHYAAMVTNMVPSLRTKSQANALKGLILEQANLRAALAWACSKPGDARVGLAITARLWEFWGMHGDLEEGHAWIEHLLTQPGSDEPTPSLAHTLNGMGVMAASRSIPFKDWLERALALFRQLGDEYGEAWVLNNLAQYTMKNEPEQAAQMLHESIQLFRRLGADWNLAWALNNLAQIALQEGQFEQVRTHLSESLALFQRSGDQRGLAWTTFVYGSLLHSEGRLEEAQHNFEQSLGLLHSAEDLTGPARVHQMAGWGALKLGNLNDAREHFKASLQIFKHTGDIWNTALCLVSFSHIALAGGLHEGAAAWLGAAIAIFRKSPRLPTKAEQDWLAPLIQSINSQLDEKTYQKAWQAGFDECDKKLEEASGPFENKSRSFP